MRYELVNAVDTARGPENPGTLSYFYNHGGLNNQKMALIGLLLSAIETGQPVNLPYIYNKDQTTDQEYLVRFDNVFDLDRLLQFANQHGVAISSACPSGERGGWNFFNRFGGFLSSARDRRSLDVVLNAIASLQPLIAADPVFHRLRDFVFGSLSADTVVQLRIEADWQEHAENLKHHLGDSEDNGIGFAQILAKVRATFPNLRMIFATADEKAMPSEKEGIRKFCRDRFNLEVVWKSDLLPQSTLENLTPLDLSLIDFEMAKYARHFVGLTSSTFSNMLALEKLARTRAPVAGHYIYNYPGEFVLERRDNGFITSAGGCLNPTWVDELLREAAAAAFAEIPGTTCGT